MEILLAAVGGFLLDLLLGDPAWMPHPVVLMGRCIAALEKLLRRAFPRTPAGERWAGRALAAALPLGTLAFTGGCLWLCGQIHPALELALSTLWCWQALAARGLAWESTRVYEALTGGTLVEARQAVGRIVGRDTGELTGAGVARAAVETVAENFSDGVIAPLIFMAIGGAPLGMFYKAANTMDSMVGYKNDKYLYFGRAAAKWDDVLNFIPARVAGVLMCLGGTAAGYDGKNAWRVFKRDRKKHKSPNSAHTEAACAGALQLRLAGPSNYFGKRVEKPYIGDDQRPIEPLDILRSGRILYATAFFALLLFCGVPLMILLFP